MQRGHHDELRCRAATPTHLCRVSFALERAAEVVDNDAGATGAKEGGIGLAETAASSGDDDDLAVVSQLITHDCEDVWCVWRRNAEGRLLFCARKQEDKEKEVAVWEVKEMGGYQVDEEDRNEKQEKEAFKTNSRGETWLRPILNSGGSGGSSLGALKVPRL